MNNNKKTLVVYFSISNNTKNVAKIIQQKLNSDIYQILAEIPYTDKDIDYYTNGRADQEQNDLNSRPRIGSLKIKNFDDYEYIFLGYPIWHGQAPRIISTFLQSYHFTNKTIIPFCTSHSTALGSSATDLQSLVDSQTKWFLGKRFSQQTSKNEVIKWIESLKLNLNNFVSKFNLTNANNKNIAKVSLNNGYQIPVVGFGTSLITGSTCKDSIKFALANGYRMFDTAHLYGNEKEVGLAIKESKIPREEIFVITKIYPGNQYLNPIQAIQESLDKLDIGYLDMMLLHHPGKNDINAYKAMEKFVNQKKIYSLGLSNWYIKEIDEFIKKVNIKPTLIQNEIHPYYQDRDVVKHMHNLNIAVQAWYPLGGRGYTKTLLNNPIIIEIANKHQVSSAQVILRWHLQNGIIVIPGSTNQNHIVENISLFDFELSQEEMKRVACLNKNEKHNWY